MARDGAGTDVARVVVQILVSRAAGREWPVVSIRSWMRNRGASGGGSQPDRAPVLEELEPRLLLNADLNGSTSLLSLPTASDGSVLMVDLDQPQEGTPEAGTPLVSLEAADSGAVADESSQVGESLGAPLDPDPVKSPVTHTQMYAGVDVQPSTATVPAAADFPVLGLPASYDLRTYGYVMPVENQGAIGSCWAFATYGSLESSVLVDGGGANDLSENHLKNYHGFDWDPTEGGNYYISEAYLSRWDGPVREADDPYHDSDDRPSPGGPPQYYVREVLEFDTDSELKNGLMTYGAIGTVMYWTDSSYNATTHTYYYNGTAYANHAVTIVGWDDNKAVPGAPGAGAWLIQNSWGAAWGEGGYFWLSYYDRQGGNDGFSFHDAVPASTYQKVYYYDDFGSVGSWNISYAFNAFTATSEQDLTAVQFWTMADGAGYEIEVYDTFSGGSLAGWLGSTYGTSEYAGMHTVNLPASIHLTAGNDFYVYLHITDGGTYPMSADWRYPGYSSACTAGAGQSYYSSDGGTWKDLRTLDSTANFSIRALVTTAMPPEIAVSGNGVAINDGDITPTSADGTDFGTAPLGGAAISRTFLVRNSGTGTLVLGSVTVPTGFTLTEGLPASLAPGASDPFTVRLDTALGGTKSGYVFIQNDDSDEHPYNFAITGVVPAPEVTVLGNGISIPDGKAGPEWDTGTDFGSVFQGGTPVVRTFTVRNDGVALLTLGPVSIPTGFTLLDGLSSSLTPGTSDTFTIQLDTVTSGYKHGDVSFANNDSDENPFNFGIDGNVSALTGPGDLDVTFMDGGKVITAVGPQSYGRAVAIQPDGKIVVAGFISNSGNYDFAVARYRPDGWLDTSFDGDGKVTTALGAASETGRDVAIQPDGKIVVVGYSNTGSNDDFAVVRYNANGSLDASFGSGGVVTTAIGSGDDWGRSVALQPDGKIVVAGRSAVGGNYAFSLVRYNADGSLDSSFDGDGKVITSVGSSSQGYNIAVQSDGKIVVVGESGGNFAVVRYNADGSWDASFGAGGIVTTDLGSSTDIGYAVALQSDGKIVASGESNSAFAVVRYNANGSLDTSFDGDGRVTTALGISGKGYSVAIQPTGKIVVAGASGVFALARYNPDGSLDTSFSEDGKVIQPFGESYAMALQSDGKIVVAGGSNYFVVARFLGDGLPSGEITVLGNGISIADGDATPGAADGTYFGSAPQGGTAISRTFTVRNDGGTALTLGAVTVPTDFALTEGLSSSLAPGASDTFTVQLDTDVVGPKAGEVSFATNDPDENPFNFRIAGTVGNLSLNQPAVASTSYAGLPAANATDGDLGSRWSSEFSDNEWIYVDLGSLYTIAQVVLRWEPAYGRGYKIQISDDASTWSDVYSTTTGDGGIDDITLTATASGRYVRMLGTQRATAYGYSLWEFEIYGYTPPEIEVLGNGVSIADGDVTPGTADDTDFGAVLQGGPALSRTFTVRNDGGSALTLGAVTVPAGFTLTEGLSASLAAGASDTFTVQLDTATAGTMAGEISFATNDSDEDPFNFGIAGTVLPAPMITVWGNGVVIADGDTTPSAADGTDFGSVVYGDPALGRTFTVRNDGGAALTLGAVTVPAGYTLTEPLASSLAPGVSDTFTVQLETTAPGIKAGEIAFSNNDAEENPFHFAITGTVLAPAEITVLGNGIVIAAGDATPDPADNTDFGSVLQGAAAVSRIFVVRNDGGATLTLGAVTVPAGFTLTEGLSTSLAAGASDTFTVRLDAAAAGIKTGDISFATNDSDENPFHFRIAGTVVPASEITVLGNGISITNGDTTPSAGDGTDFGFAAQGAAGVSRTFTVRNDGSAVLVLGPVTVPAGYTLTEGLSTSLAPGEFDTFTVQLDTALTGTLMGDVSFSTNDPDENPFGFRISGTVVDDGNLALGRPVTASTSYGGLSASNVTDGNPASRWSSQFSDNEWIYVDLGSVFTIKRVVLRWEAAYGRGYKIQISGDASSWSDVYSTVAGDGGVDEITLSAPAAGRYVRMLGTQRATVYGYSLWEFEVYAGGGGAPQVTVTVAPSGVAEDGPANLVYTFTRSVADGSPLTVSFTVGGTATFGVDYTPSGAASFDAASGTVTIPASQTTATVTVDPTADTTTEPDETVILTVAAGTGYTVGTPAASTGTIQNDDASGNLALGRPATASTSYTGLPASNATDGNPGSRWSSQFSDNEWLYVDLGATYTINRVVLRWEAAYGRGYKLQVSSDASTWSDVYSTATGDGGVDDITLAAPASGRYVRMLGTQRATMYGYSLFEIEVYGGGAVNHAPAVSDVSKSLMQDAPLSFAAADFAAAFTDPDAGDSLQKIKIASLPTHGALTLNGAAVAVDQEIPAAELGTLVYTPNSGYTGSDSFQWNGSDGSLYAAATAAVNLSISAAAANLALHKTAVASTSYSGLPASNATDGNVNSRWSSQFSDNEWLYVDLGAVFPINRVVLRWEAAYGRSYKLQVSGDASTWSDVYVTTIGDGGVDDIALAAPASGRYVRLLGLQRATVYGYSLYELEVYGGGAEGPEITVLGNGVTITKGDLTPSASDGTDFGGVAPGGAGISRVFAVRNDGMAVLTLGPVTVPVGYILTEALAASLAPGASDTFTVQLDGTTMGIKTGDISFTNDDTDENPFTFRITGTVAVPGSLDPTFGTGGIVTTMIGRSNDWGTSMVVQPDGKIVVAGFRYVESTYDDFTVVRYNTDGSLDSSFGTGGIAITALTLGYDQAHGVALQPDGKIVVAGTADDDFAVVRYNPDGSLDTSFGTGGQVITVLGPGEDYGASVTIQPDGKILMAGYSYNIVSNDELALVRYNANGSLDTSFGVGGKVIMPIYDTRDRASSVVLQRDGKIVVAGYTVFHSQEDVALLRFNANGTLDTSFGVGGMVTTDLNGSSNDVVTSMALQPDGRIVVLGVSYYDVALARYNTDGSLDASFGTAGKVITNVGGISDYANSLVIQPNGQILVAGECNSDIALLRYNANGSVDTSFGVGGKVFTPIGSWLAEGTSVALQSDGRIVVAGYMLGPGNELGPNFDFVVVRYLNDVSPEPEITVLGNGLSIADGDTTPNATDGTGFGSVVKSGPVVSRTFTVRNDGTATLTLGAVTVPAGFTLTESLSSSLAPGESDTFTVRLDTATAGTKAGDISFDTNDSDENPFNFRITGTVTETATNLALGKTAVASTSYTGLPASNATDGNLNSRWSSQFSDSEWIYVDLAAVYTIYQVVLRWEAAYGRGYRIQVSTDASTWTDVYGTTTGDGGADDITLVAPVSCRYVRLLGTQRATVYGYSLWEFEVYA